MVKEYLHEKTDAIADAIIDRIKDSLANSFIWVLAKIGAGILAVLEAGLPLLSLIGILLYIAGYKRGGSITSYSLIGYLFVMLYKAAYGG